MRFIALAVATVWLCAPDAVRAELRGHGGPVRAVAVSVDGRSAISGSFDQSIIVWSLETGAATQVLRQHEGAVNAVVALPDGRFATGGEDGRVALWRPGRTEPERVIEGHQGPVAGLAVSPDGSLLVSASWDGTARVIPTGGGDGRVLDGHHGNVNAAAFLPDGRIVTASYDNTLRFWPSDNRQSAVVTLPSPLNAVVAAQDGEIIVAGADGVMRILDSSGVQRAEVEIATTPVIALALSPDGNRIAAASIGGAVAVLDRSSAKVQFHLVGPGLPIWSLAFAPDGLQLLTGGSDRVVRRWNMITGEHVGPIVIARPEDPLVRFQGERGAQVFQACAACHTLTQDGGNRAGPTLHGLFGRRIGTANGYNFSDALRRLDIIWTPETVAKLFEIGPSRYTPGTKMPEQIIASAEDRDALVRFLQRATR